MTLSATPDAGIPRWQRWLLPATVAAVYAERDAVGGAKPSRSLRDWLVDVMLFCFALFVGAAFVANHQRHFGEPLVAIDALAGIAPCLALWVRRRHPLAVGWLAVGFSAFSGASVGAGVVALFTVAVHCPPRRTLQLALLSVVAAVSNAAIYSEGRFPTAGLSFWLVMSVAVVGFGLYVRARRELLLSLQERALRAEDEQQLRAREAQLAERARIAREMHDVLAHRISLLSVHAGALEFNPDASPGEIARAAAVIRESAREAQEELRGVIGVLRAEAEAEDAEPPQPTIADLTRLIDESRAVGMDVTLSNRLSAEPLPPILGRTVYRVVQEALTNARKHAPGQAVTIAIEGDRSVGIRLRVVNQPRVGHADAGEVDAAAAEHVGAGMGLVGLSERVSLVGGRLGSEVLPAGGF
ncbi:MAG: histidine kinase, partial [Conexibacteraceae bacterium]|nr:histidine kinase [Conexibacteraceae bacterium]